MTGLTDQQKRERWSPPLVIQVEGYWPTEDNMNTWHYARSKCGHCNETGREPQWCWDHNDICYIGGPCMACLGTRLAGLDRDPGDEQPCSTTI